MTARLRAGLIGLGVMGRHHARALNQLDGVQLVGICDPNGDPHHAAAGVPVVAELDQLLALGLDYAVVACPTRLHEPVGLRLAAAGIPALIEKPLAHDVAAGGRLVAAYREAGIPAAVGHIERYNPAVMQLHARLAAGELGELYLVATRRQGPFPTRVTDVGVGLDLAIHDIDLTTWLTGQHYTSITAHTAARAGREHEDLLVATGLLTAGIVTSHLANWLSPRPKRLIAVTGERGCLAADTRASTLDLYRPGRPTTRRRLPARDPLTEEHRAFRDALLGRPSALVPLSAALRALTTIETMLLPADGPRSDAAPTPPLLPSTCVRS